VLTRLTATCGHEVLYTPLPDKQLDAVKLAKVLGRACRDCRLKRTAEITAKEQAAAKARREKKREKKLAAARLIGMEPGELRKTAVTLMPDGTIIQLQRIGDTWHGAAISGGRTIRATGPTPVNVLKRLAAAVCFGAKGPAAADRPGGAKS
jgi:hypothetical protein